MGIWGMPVPKVLLLVALLCPPAFTIRCYTDLEATQVLELDNLAIFPEKQYEDDFDFEKYGLS